MFLPPAARPSVALPRRFLACPMATPPACLRSPPAPPWSSCPPPSPRPNPLCSRQSTPRSQRHCPLGRPRDAPPCLRYFSPVSRGPVACAPPPPSSSPSRLFSALSMPCRSAFPMHLRSVLPTLFLPPPPPAGLCDHSPRPLRSFPRPRPPISPVRTKMSAIGRAGLLRVGWWRADPRPVGKSPVGLA